MFSQPLTLNKTQNKIFVQSSTYYFICWFFLHVVVGSLLVGTSTDVLHHLSLRVEHPVAPGAAEDHLLLVVVSLAAGALVLLLVLVLVIDGLLCLPHGLDVREDALGHVPGLPGVVLGDQAAQGPEDVLVSQLLVVEPEEEI